LTVEQAKRTRGALLFRQRGGGANDHVVISLGDGHTIEAMGRAYGVRIGVVAGRDWTSGGYVPGLHVNPPSVQDTKPRG
jgi:N-acetylmuramoyl-L-alanine amidase